MAFVGVVVVLDAAPGPAAEAAGGGAPGADTFPAAAAPEPAPLGPDDFPVAAPASVPERMPAAEGPGGVPDARPFAADLADAAAALEAATSAASAAASFCFFSASLPRRRSFGRAREILTRSGEWRTACVGVGMCV